MATDDTFSPMQLPDTLIRDLRRMNPWWQGRPQRPLPATRRHLVDAVHRRFANRLAPIVVVRGPRQIGKTTAVRHVVADLLAGGVPPSHLLFVQFDELEPLELAEPILRLADWFEDHILRKTLNQAAHDGEPTWLVFDEVQNLPRWAPQLKSLVDHSETMALVTGSSALRIEAGRDSLAGRITTLEAGVLSLTEIAAFYDLDLGPQFLEDNGLDALGRKDFWSALRDHGQARRIVRDQVFRHFSERGGYPVGHLRGETNWPLVADQLNETVIRRVIRHDVGAAEEEQEPPDPRLLEEVFRLACRYAGQAPGPRLFAREIRRALAADVGVRRIEQELRRLADTLLLRLVPPLEIRLRKTSGHAKICLCDHALRASWLQEIIPLDARALSDRAELTSVAGHLAESVTGTALSTIPGLGLAHLPARRGEPEVDFVLAVGDVRIPLEVKYQRRIDALRDTEGLRTFIEKTVNRAPFGLLVTQNDDAVIDDPRIVALPLSTLLLLR